MMSELLQFVMINLKNSGSDFDFESSTKKLLENIKKDLRTNDFNFFRPIPKLEMRNCDR